MKKDVGERDTFEARGKICFAFVRCKRSVLVAIISFVTLMCNLLMILSRPNDIWLLQMAPHREAKFYLKVYTIQFDVEGVVQLKR